MSPSADKALAALACSLVLTPEIMAGMHTHGMQLAYCLAGAGEHLARGRHQLQCNWTSTYVCLELLPHVQLL